MLTMPACTLEVEPLMYESVVGRFIFLVRSRGIEVKETLEMAEDEYGHADS